MKVRVTLVRWDYTKNRHPKLEEKSVTVEAESFVDAYFNVIPKKYPDWAISMAWPVIE